MLKLPELYILTFNIKMIVSPMAQSTSTDVRFFAAVGAIADIKYAASERPDL
jgi:hypothetical protein